jgi:hypothetical protein
MLQLAQASLLCTSRRCARMRTAACSMGLESTSTPPPVQLTFWWACAQAQMLRLAEERAELDRQLAAADAEVSRLGDEELRCHVEVGRALRQVQHSRWDRVTHSA